MSFTNKKVNRKKQWLWFLGLYLSSLAIIAFAHTLGKTFIRLIS